MTWTLKIFKVFTLIGSFCARYITFDLKNYRVVIFYATEQWCKIWRNTDLWFGKWHGEYGKFSSDRHTTFLIFPRIPIFWNIFARKSIFKIHVETRRKSVAEGGGYIGDGVEGLDKKEEFVFHELLSWQLW